MASKIQLRRDLAATWTSVNPVLSAGEMGYETDTDKVKIGDGATAWTSLSYLIDGTTGAETDAVVGAVSGIVKADGAGNISAASAGTDYQVPLSSGVDYQAPLVSGTNIKTVNGSSILGAGDLSVAGTGGIALTDISVTDNSGNGASLAYDNITGVFTFNYTAPTIPTDIGDLSDAGNLLGGGTDFTSLNVTIFDETDAQSVADGLNELITQLQSL